jgi:hypothetical protein
MTSLYRAGSVPAPWYVPVFFHIHQIEKGIALHMSVRTDTNRKTSQFSLQRFSTMTYKEMLIYSEVP